MSSYKQSSHQKVGVCDNKYLLEAMFLWVGQTPHLGQFLLTSSSAVCTANGWSLFHIFMLLEASLGIAEKAVMALGRLWEKESMKGLGQHWHSVPSYPRGKANHKLCPGPHLLKGEADGARTCLISDCSRGGLSADNLGRAAVSAVMVGREGPGSTQGYGSSFQATLVLLRRRKWAGTWVIPTMSTTDDPCYCPHTRGSWSQREETWEGHWRHQAQARNLPETVSPFPLFCLSLIDLPGT